MLQNTLFENFVFCGNGFGMKRKHRKGKKEESMGGNLKLNDLNVCWF